MLIACVWQRNVRTEKGRGTVCRTCVYVCHKLRWRAQRDTPPTMQREDEGPVWEFFWNVKQCLLAGPCTANAFARRFHQWTLSFTQWPCGETRASRTQPHGKTRYRARLPELRAKTTSVGFRPKILNFLDKASWFEWEMIPLKFVGSYKLVFCNYD